MDLKNRENMRCRNCIHWGCAKSYDPSKHLCFNGLSVNYLKIKKHYQKCRNFHWRLDKLWHLNEYVISVYGVNEYGGSHGKAYIYRVPEDVKSIDEISTLAVQQFMWDFPEIIVESICITSPTQPAFAVLRNTSKYIEINHTNFIHKLIGGVKD